MNSENLTKYYHTLTKDLKRISQSSNRAEELCRMIYSSECLRIFLIGNVKTQKITIEVELSLPSSLLYDTDDNPNESKKIANCVNLREIMEQQISNLYYLMNLNDIGFSLDIIKEEGCLWVAEKTLETEPNDLLCKMVFPSLLH
ncbi:MAG: hypothetical protein JSW11_01585 [Candidatus Heimdallarchaeota archaeon]|nr:MAG: hypothetical protein JSW11_01585 [Candidatus Heimdallarchaeota archaeon]